MVESSATATIAYQTYKQSNYESKTIRLSSPILHIGGQISSLNPFEYVQTRDKVYLPNQEEVAKGLYQQGRVFLNDYISAIANGDKIENLLQQAFGQNWTQAKSPDSRPIFPDVRSKWIQDKEQQITDLRPMIRNGMGQLYIPGSSIKGAMRTAILYHLLKHSDRYQVPSGNRLSDIEQKLRQKLKHNQINNSNKAFLDDELEIDRLFNNYFLSYQDRIITPKNKQNTDFFRAIKVYDSQPLLPKIVKLKKSGKQVERNIPVVAEVIVSSYFNNNKAKYRASIFAEMVAEVSTEFTITLDREMLSWFHHHQNMKIPFRNLDEVFKINQEFAQDQWNQEITYWSKITNNIHRDKVLDFNLIWQKYYAKSTCPYSLRLGWGNGIGNTTINWLLPEDLRTKIRDKCGTNAPTFQAPKSRRTIIDDQGQIAFATGWTKLKY